MSVDLSILVVLVIAEAVGTGAFLAMFLARSAWRSNPVGRHLALYAGALLGVYTVTAVRILHRVEWSFWLMILAHAVFLGAIWQRVWLLVREQRRADDR